MYSLSGTGICRRCASIRDRATASALPLGVVLRTFVLPVPGALGHVSEAMLSSFLSASGESATVSSLGGGERLYQRSTTVHSLFPSGDCSDSMVRNTMYPAAP